MKGRLIGAVVSTTSNSPSITTKQESTVCVLGSDEETPTPIKPADGKLLLTVSARKFQVDRVAQPHEGEADGSASRFAGKHEKQGVVQKFAGTINGEVDGAPFPTGTCAIGVFPTWCVPNRYAECSNRDCLSSTCDAFGCPICTPIPDSSYQNNSQKIGVLGAFLAVSRSDRKNSGTPIRIATCGKNTSGYGMEAGGIEPPSCDSSESASTCVVR